MKLKDFVSIFEDLKILEFSRIIWKRFSKTLI